MTRRLFFPMVRTWIGFFWFVLVSSLGFPYAHAASGVGIVYSSTLASIGGGGGNDFGTITCPSGQLVTGFNFWSENVGGSLDGKGLQARCSTITLSGTAVQVTYAGTSAVGGSASYSSYSGSCPAGQVVTGVDAQATTWPVLGWLRLYCSSVTYNSSTKTVSIGAAPGSPSTGIIGPNYSYGGTYYNRVVAPTGSAIGGFSGRSGASLDQVNFNAYTITQASLTLTAVVNGGPASPSSFTLRATDSNGVGANYTSGQENVVTPSTYTLSSPSIPSNYVLTSITNCANPVVLNNGSIASCFFNYTYQPTISGTVSLDSLGTGVTGTGINGVTVRLYNSAGTYLTATTTDASGNYSFSGYSAGVYYVTVQAPTSGAALAEQTYASAGTGNGGSAGGSGYGPICTGATPTYSAQSGTTPSAWSAQTSTYCFGGAEGAVADSGVTTLASNEHITRIDSSGGNAVTGVNFAFSYNVVTNTNDSGQGSLRQFITNANTLSGANSMRFVPAVVTNASGVGGSWWRTTLLTELPIISDVSTSLIGIPYSNLDGSSALSQLTGNIQAGMNVGYGPQLTAIPAVPRPQFEVTGLATGSFVIGSSAASTSITYFSVTGGYQRGILLATGAGNFTIQHNSVGMAPDGSLNTQVSTDTISSAIYVGDPNGINGSSGMAGLIANNAIKGTKRSIYLLTLTGLTANQLKIQQNYLLRSTGDYNLGIINSGAISVLNNYVTGGGSWAIGVQSSPNGTYNGNTSTYSTGGPVLILNGSSASTVIGNDLQYASGVGFRTDFSANNLVQQNRIINNVGAGISASGNPATGNRYTQNIYGNNGGAAIGLGGLFPHVNTTSCINSVGTSGGNSGLARPTITGMTLIGSSLTVQGTMCNVGIFTIEVYAATAGAGDTGSDGLAAGEGTTYLGSLTGQTGGVFYGTLSGVTGLTSGSAVSVIAIRTATGGTGVIGDTSEFSPNIMVTDPNWGRAPDTYKTLSASGGAQHYIINTLKLGATEVGSVDASPVAAYTALNLNTGGSDGVVSFPQLTLGNTTYSVQVTATNQTGSAANLVGWIDFNRDGVFTASEGVSVTVPTGSNNAAFTLNWSGVGSLFSASQATRLGPTYARFRLSTSAGLTTSTPAGLMTNGEVEDYGGTGVLEIIGRNILGNVYNDINRNGIFDSSETGSGQSLYAKLTPVSGTTCTGPATQVVAVNTTSGAYSLIGIPPGSYCVVVDTNNTLSDITPNLPSGWTFTDGLPGTRVVSLTAGSDLPNINFGINNDQLVNVEVFYDTGSGGGSAYDAIKQSGEAGVATTITATGNAGSATYTTAADGSLTLALTSAVTTGSGDVTFTVTVPSTAVSVTKGVTTLTDSAAATSTTTITVAAASLNGGGTLRFGLAPAAQLLPDNIQNGGPGSVVFHPHQFKVSSAGTLVLSIASQTASPNNSGWGQAFYTDPGCTGSLSSSSTVISGAITIATGGSTYCFINRVSIPATASNGDQLLQTVNAQFTYGSTPASTSLSVQDSTMVGEDSKLKLVKTVDKATAQSGAGEILTYTVTYTNQDLATMSPVVIYDSVPQMTTLVAGSTQCVAPLPAGITCNVSHNASTGGITWTLTGGLQPSGSGSVQYKVTIN